MCCICVRTGQPIWLAQRMTGTHKRIDSRYGSFLATYSNPALKPESAMKLSLRSLLVILVPAVFFLQGCDTSGVAGRAQEKATVYNALSPAVQKHIKDGSVEVGYTEDMVYIALGKPNSVETKFVGSGPVQVWVYQNMALDTKAGWRGLSYNSDIGAVPGGSTSLGNSSAPPAPYTGKYATQINNTVNEDASDASSQVPDLPMGTLYLFFYKGRVFRMNMKS